MIERKCLGASLVATLFCILLSLSACSDSVDPAQRLAVADAMEAFRVSFSGQYLPEKGKTFDEAREEHIRELRDVSVSECPKDFQDAWNNYLAEVRQARSINSNWRRAGQAIESGDLSSIEDMRREQEIIDSASMKLWKMAAKYDRKSARMLEDISN